VVAVIALLVAILLPALDRARRHGGRIACASNLRTLLQAVNYYRMEENRYPLPGDHDPARMVHDLTRHSGNQVCRLNPCGDRWTINNIGDLAEALVAIYLRRPDPMFCPVSLRKDP